MNRRKLLQSGLATLGASGISKLPAAPASGNENPDPARSAAAGMKAYLGGFTFSGVTAPALVIEIKQPWRLICWAEAQYVPCWDTKNLWVTTEWLETLGTKSAYDFEPISDKKLKYTHVELLEIGPARAVLHWRYALCDSRERIFHDNTTAEEFHIIYPDGFTVRKVVAYPGTGNPREGQPKMWEVAEYLMIFPPGTTTSDNLDPEGMTITNIDGDAYRHRLDMAPLDFSKATLDDILHRLCLVHPSSRDWSEFIWEGGLKNRPSPFLVAPNDQKLFPHLRCHVCHGDHPETLLWRHMMMWKHWPLGHEEYEIGIPATDADAKKRAVSASYVTMQPWVHPVAWDHPDPAMPFDAKWNPPQGTTWVMLQGINPGDDKFPRRLAASWTRPANTRMNAGTFFGYEPAERAYLFEPADRRVDFEFHPRSDAAQINPVAIVEKWTFGNPHVTVDGRELIAEDFAVSWVGTRLIVWFRGELTKTTRIVIEGWSG